MVAYRREPITGSHSYRKKKESRRTSGRLDYCKREKPQREGTKDDTGNGWLNEAGKCKDGGKRTVTAACIKKDGKETGAMVQDMSAMVMHGELLGVIMALVQTRLEEPKEVTILTDYKNVVKRIQEFQENGQMDESSWYRWICSLWKEVENNGPRIKIQHVRAHVDVETASTHELLNHQADRVANEARQLRTLNRLAWPTFEMQNYVI
jgi:ribonuclease HI